MARYTSEESVRHKVTKLLVDQSIELDNPYNSVAVMVSMLKRSEENRNKIFKIKIKYGKTFVTRVK